ncbi:acetamidase [Massilia arenosa]|uniref:Acetamidase n=1 Tax=Zemynaea arenosa TaxID=2561931 RepID=A0A4Y9SIC3_9BURK|nr:acetamidase/formamidase family protein [Massilia arenosa]TFW20392.1 acetamidase [Massilia arenosa]
MRALLLLMLLGLAMPSDAAADTWLLRVNRWGTWSAMTLKTDRLGPQWTGTLDGDSVQGRVVQGAIEFEAVDRQGRSYRYAGQVDGAAMAGTADFPDPNHDAVRVTHRFTARRLPERRSAAPQQHVYHPVDYANEFSAQREPVLTIWPGDTVRTTTLDSGGVDAQGVTRALYGNPQTGPFFIMGAEAGDTLAVHLRRVRLNRDWAGSLDTLVPRAQSTSIAGHAAPLGKPVRWRLDLAHGLAWPADAGTKLARLVVPVRPMLGGLAVAPGDGPGIFTGDAGTFGGNMDFNEVVEGATVYLPVQQPGGLLYLGDGHALQGDGETTQFALETSLDVEFTVDLIKHQAIRMPRVETATHLMTLGQAGSLDDALKIATAGMIQWLQQAYGLGLQEAAVVLGSSVEYRVVTLAGRSAGLAAKLEKGRLDLMRATR